MTVSHESPVPSVGDCSLMWCWHQEVKEQGMCCRQKLTEQSWSGSKFQRALGWFSVRGFESEHLERWCQAQSFVIEAFDCLLSVRDLAGADLLHLVKWRRNHQKKKKRGSTDGQMDAKAIPREKAKYGTLLLK